MKRNKKSILAIILIMVFSICAVNTNAQLKGLKNLKKKAEKTVKKTVGKTESKTGNKGYTKDCLALKKRLENSSGDVERYLTEENLTMARSRLVSMQKLVKRYKDANCPFGSNWEKKYEELENKYNLGTIQDNPEGFLLSAVLGNNKENVDIALEQGANINGLVRTRFARVSALEQAVTKENLEMVKYLLEKGADINLGSNKDRGCGFALYNSVKINNLEITRFLLSKGADIGKKGHTIACIAAKNNNLEMIKEFEKHSDFDLSSAKEGVTPLSQAPNNSEVKKYIRNRVLENKLAKVKDATNKKYANRIVFSNEKIPAKGASEAKFKTKLQASKDMYGRIYFGCFASDYYYGTRDDVPGLFKAEIRIWAQIEGDDEEWHIETINLYKVEDATSFELQLNKREYRSTFAKLFIRLKQGDNKVKFYLKRNSDILIEEEVILTKKPGDTYKIGKTLADFKAGKMNTPTYKAAVLKAIQSHAASAGWKEKFTAVKILSSDWNIVRNRLTGVILYRTIGAWCYAKWPDGHCTVQDFYFKQNYNGSSYSKVYQRSSTGSQVDVDCN